MLRDSRNIIHGKSVALRFGRIGFTTYSYQSESRNIKFSFILKSRPQTDQEVYKLALEYSKDPKSIDAAVMLLEDLLLARKESKAESETTFLTRQLNLVNKLQKDRDLAIMINLLAIESNGLKTEIESLQKQGLKLL